MFDLSEALEGTGHLGQTQTGGLHIVETTEGIVYHVLVQGFSTFQHLHEVSGRQTTVCGRVIYGRDNQKGVYVRVIWFDKSKSRLTGASVAGLVVGAMGVFIFGLYLRAWMRERKAA
jgi:hypothetical protein